MQKRVFLSVLVLLCLLCTTVAIAESELTSGDFTYTIEGKKARIVSYDGNATDLTIPDQLDGYPVTIIGEAALSGNETLHSVVVPDSVLTIEVDAFDNCQKLTSLVLPASVIEIEPGALSRSPLTLIEVAEDNPVYAMFDGVLYDKTTKQLHTYPADRQGASFAVPEGILSIADYAFFDNKTLSSIVLPDSITELGSMAFYSMTSMTSLFLPDSVDNIAVDAFEASGIEAFEVSDSNPWLATTDGVLYVPADKTLLQYPPAKQGSTFAIPPGITCIANCAFETTRYLETVTIPDSVTTINNAAFYKSSVTSIVLPNSVTSVGDYIFYKSDLTQITLSSGMTAIPKGMMYYCDLTSIEIPDTITEIGDYAFFYSWDLTDVKLPNGVTKIGVEAFYGCRDLLSVTVPASVTEIGEDAFGNCEALTVWVTENSYAREYMEENEIPYSIRPSWL